MPADFTPEPSPRKQAPWVHRGAELFASVHDMLVPILDAWDWRLTMLVWRAHVGNPPQEVELSFLPEGDNLEEIVERAYLLDRDESPMAPQIHWGAYSESSFFDDQLDGDQFDDRLDEHQDTWAMEITLLLPSDFDSGAALWGSLAGPHDPDVTCDDHECDPETCECPNHLLWNTASFDIEKLGFQTAFVGVLTQLARDAKESYPESSFRPRML